jgi:16S rRNA (guanine966-N2)-methyltransferase
VGAVTRIVAGAAGRRRLMVPPSGTRPTSERVREGLFSALEAAGAVRGARVLDLYAGSGALGFEAISRGAASARLVESDARAARTLRDNVAGLALPGAQLRATRVEKLLDGTASAFDLVFVDPPYETRADDLDTVLAKLAGRAWCAPGGIVVVERGGRVREPEWPAGISALRTQRYGETTLHWGRHD